MSSCRATPFPPCSGTPSKQRGDNLDAAEGAGHLAQLELARPPRPCARSRRPAWPSASRRASARPSCPTPSSNGCWPTWPCSAAAACPTASTRPTPPRRCITCARTRAPRILFVEDDEQLDKALEVRAGLPGLRRDRRVRHGRPARPRRPDVMSLDALRALGREHLAAIIPPWSSGVAGAAPKTWPSWSTPRAPPASPRARCTAHAGLVYTVRGYNTLIAQDEKDERMCFLPLCHIAERMGGEYFALYTGSILNFVENPETVPENVREIAPTVFTAVPRVWEKFYSGVMIALKEASPLQQAAYAWSIGVGDDHRRRCWRASRSARAEAQVQAGAAAGAGQRAQADRHRPRALPGDRRGADLARAGEVVPGAGRADAGGVGHDRVLRRLDRACRPPHQARLHRPGHGLQRGAHRAGHRRDPGARPQRLHGLPEPAGEDRRDHRRRRLAAHRRRRRVDEDGFSASPTA
jgi:hypothetical protein